jgi:hypothetical protein
LDEEDALYIQDMSWFRKKKATKMASSGTVAGGRIFQRGREFTASLTAKKKASFGWPSSFCADVRSRKD